MSLRPATFPWDRFLGAQALASFARAVGGARGGELPVSREAVARLEVIRAALTERKDAYWADQVEIQRLAGDGLAGPGRGQVRRGADAPRSPRPTGRTAPRSTRSRRGAVLPAREMLGDLLLEQGRAPEALAAYETSLESAPGRYLSILGAARAAGRAGAPNKAREYYTDLLALCEKSDGSRPGVVEARAFLARAD